MMAHSCNKQAAIIDAFNTAPRYLDDILNINNDYFDNMVSQIYPLELQLNPFTAVYKCTQYAGGNTAILILLWCYI